MQYLVLAEQLVDAVKRDVEADAYVNGLGEGSVHELEKELTDDNKKKVFWINVYNGFVSYMLKQKRIQQNSETRFFSRQTIRIAGHRLSLDQIEHGILRRSQLKWAFGFIANPLTSSFEKKLRLRRADNRVHFALNCGAESCPPIRFYYLSKVDEQLHLAMRSYLDSEVALVKDGRIVRVPRLMLWYLGDFGGFDGIRKLLAHNGYIPAKSRPVIRFNRYNWKTNIKYDSI